MVPCTLSSETDTVTSIEKSIQGVSGDAPPGMACQDSGVRDACLGRGSWVRDGSRPRHGLSA